MNRGAFITLEGGEGVGKTTSLRAIEDHFGRLDRELVITREPGGTELGEAVRSWILDGDHGPLSADVEALLMFASRAHHLERVIRPALARGAWVVCDRFTDATVAYQGGGRGADPNFLRTLANAVQRGLAPDLTILLDAPVAVGMARIADREHDHFEREETAFFERVRETYLALAAAEPERFRVIDATREPDTVRASIRSTLDCFTERFETLASAGT